MREHTRGPWRSHGAGGEIHGNSRVVATMTWCSGMQAEDEANARLIAAAPDMLDALCYAHTDVTAAIKFVEHDLGEGEARGLRQMLVRIDAAVAKATSNGEPPT